jgi:dihydrofolate reductase
MGNVVVALSMSLDGFIAGPQDGPQLPLGRDGMSLFDWYFTGDTPVPAYASAAERGIGAPPFKLSPPSARVFNGLIERGGASVTGRRTYELANAWGGNGPLPGQPLFVVTHRPPESWPRGESEYTFVTDGIERAIEQARAAAGEKDVGLMGASVPQQCLRAGLLDEIQLHLVPVLLGGGVSLFDRLGTSKIDLQIVEVVDAPGVTHLRYRVMK